MGGKNSKDRNTSYVSGDKSYSQIHCKQNAGVKHLTLLDILWSHKLIWSFSGHPSYMGFWVTGSQLTGKRYRLGHAQKKKKSSNMIQKKDL